MNSLQAKVNVLGRLHPLSGDITPFGAHGRVTGGVAPFVSLRGYPFGHDVLREMRCCRPLRG